MKNLLYIFTLLFFTSCHSQEKDKPTQATQSDNLAIWTSSGMNEDCMFLERPVYYINENYVVYQDCNTRKILYADIPTFEMVKYYTEYGLALDKNGVYIKGDFVATDTTGFTFLGNNEKDLLWKTNTSVYKNTTVLPELIASEFTRLSAKKEESYSRIYFKDNQNVYYFDKKIEGADLVTADLVYSDSRVFYDKNYMYKDGEIVYFEGEPLLYVNNSLKKTATKVIYNNKVVPNIDAKTLVGLSRHYAKDKNNVYCSTFVDGIQTLPIKKADFNKIKVFDHTNSAYITDGKNLFYREYMFPKGKFDVATFGTFGFTDFVYDKNGVYTRCFDEKQENVVYCKFPFKYTDDVSSENLQITKGSSLYVYYNNQAYEESTKTLYEDLTPEQIEISKNRPHTPNKVRLAELNGKTVLRTLFDYKLTKDDNTVYHDDKKTNADAVTFRKLDYNYYIDKDNVYTYDREKGLQAITYIDVETAKYFNGFIKDKNYLYRNGIQIIKSDKLEILASYPGYRKGCGLDTQPSSDYYLFKNIEGHWIVLVAGNDVKVRYIGLEVDEKLKGDIKVYPVHITAEVLPEYPEGLNKLNEFFKENFKIPNLERSIKGRVILQFIVEKDGSLSDIKVLRDLGHGTGKEAVRLLKLAGKWNTGLQNGESVRVRYTLPVPVDVVVKQE